MCFLKTYTEKFDRVMLDDFEVSIEELDECFNPEHHLNQVDTIFKRAGLE